MITAKALKPTSPSRSQPTREDYVESEQQKRWVLPLAFLLFLTGCAAYLKSFLPVKLEAREAEKASKHDDGDQSDPPSDDVVGAPAEEAEEDAAAKSAERNPGSSGNVVPIRIAYDNDDNPASGSSAIEAAPAPALRVATGPTGEPIRAANDKPPFFPSTGG
jgi:hypothetical protein